MNGTNFTIGIHKPEAAEVWLYRKMQRISYQAKKTNKQVTIQINQDKPLTIKKRQFNFFGHTIR